MIVPHLVTRVALVEDVPPSGFLGVAGNDAAGEVEFVRNDPERLTLRVRAPERGFVHLADQYADGRRATVTGQEVPILRANYLFRAVEVPAGESTIEMRYVTPGLRLGAVISLVTGDSPSDVRGLRHATRGVPATERRRCLSARRCGRRLRVLRLQRGGGICRNRTRAQPS